MIYNKNKILKMYIIYKLYNKLYINNGVNVMAGEIDIQINKIK